MQLLVTSHHNFKLHPDSTSGEALVKKRQYKFKSLPARRAPLANPEPVDKLCARRKLAAKAEKFFDLL
jgi:hypothetical protein